ncbi:unnamed protein product [Calypogeia fissa]
MVLLCKNPVLLFVVITALLMGMHAVSLVAKKASSTHDEDEYVEDEVYIHDGIPPMCTATGEGGLSTSCNKVPEIKMKGESAKKGLKVDLVHMDHHPSSPLYEPKINLISRIKNAVKRSKHRANGLSRTLLTGTKKREIDLDFSDVAFSSSSQDSFESPVSASPGSYIMRISLGTPPQIKTAIADTGSDLVWLQCSPCTSCYKQDDPIFNPTKSSSYKTMSCSSTYCSDLPYHACSRKKSCSYGYAYGDQSTTQGDFATETITLTTLSGETEPVTNFAFGCGHKNQGTFSGTDGLVGLGQGPISFPSQLGQLFGNKFSYCLVSASDAATQTSPLIFGEAEIQSSLNLQYTPLVRNNLNPTFYYVLLTGISVDGNLVTIPASTFDITSSGTGGVILDSGTTITMLVQAAYTPFLAMLKALITYPIVDSSQIGLDLCYDLSQVESPTFPSVMLHFANVDLDLPAANVFLTVDEQGTTCLAFAGSTDFTIIGNLQQQNYLIMYDRQNQRVGFAQTQCDTLSSDGSAQSH